MKPEIENIFFLINFKHVMNLMRNKKKQKNKKQITVFNNQGALNALGDKI